MRNGPYIFVLAPVKYPGKKYRGKYCYEHHLVWWRATGVVVKTGQVIHHINKNKQDNRKANLKLLSHREHSLLHGAETKKTEPNAQCNHCKKKIRVRPFKLKNKFKFCSRQCIGLYNFRNKRQDRGAVDNSLDR